MEIQREVPAKMAIVRLGKMPPLLIGLFHSGVPIQVDDNTMPFFIPCEKNQCNTADRTISHKSTELPPSLSNESGIIPSTTLRSI